MSTDTLVTLAGCTALACAPDGPKICGGDDATDVIGAALGHGVELVVLPVRRLAVEFFTLRTGVAGEVVQKFVNYRLRLAVVGDISGHVTRSTALRDFVVEADRGRQLRFVDTLAELEERLRVEALRQDAGGR
ncbi:protein of unknown function (DUF4180) [Micromonospora matsumotoense]|uniref:DUF4180 domain-containing protein n=1 Tax=Micromonospora matsumotoense TaxID=121616 RepID=A0A1C4YDM7_9ACTN|nr:DUF4180 domain-containing protein [Micromonospora matsumotoense]SCF18825.1 protein of unknown function (DUF4180) [Micromonospora matsumotoense]